MKTICIFFLGFAMTTCVSLQEKPVRKTTVIFDGHFNAGIDDQHALAYLLFSGNVFHVAGVTVNATTAGGTIDNHYEEAKRVMRLCGYHGRLPLYKGANENFDSLQHLIKNENFDGSQAVNFIIEEVNDAMGEDVVIIATGKLTNIALALKKAPDIATSLRIVWLGSNYPAPGEYNLISDTASLNYILKTDVRFEITTVDEEGNTGASAVRATPKELNTRLSGKGPEVIIPVGGRHGGEFKSFGNYALNLLTNAGHHKTMPAYSLPCLVAVAIVKNRAWSKEVSIPAPLYYNNQWQDRQNNTRTIVLLRNFDNEKILSDFYYTIDNYQLAE